MNPLNIIIIANTLPFEVRVFTVGQTGQDTYSAWVINKLVLHVWVAFLSPMTIDAFHKTIYYNYLIGLLSPISLLFSPWVSLLISLELSQKLFQMSYTPTVDIIVGIVSYILFFHKIWNIQIIFESLFIWTNVQMQESLFRTNSFILAINIIKPSETVTYK